MSNDRIRTAFITVLGAGFAPFASGSWGSLAALVLYLPLWFACGLLSSGPIVLEVLTVSCILIAALLSVRWGGWAIEKFGRSDPKQFVLDEFAGQWIALLFMPQALDADLWTLACVFGGQFFLFRLFDVLKLPPARQAEYLPSGWGVLTDDLIAGVFANVAGQLLWRITPLAAWLGVTGLQLGGGG